MVNGMNGAATEAWVGLYWLQRQYVTLLGEKQYCGPGTPQICSAPEP